MRKALLSALLAILTLSHIAAGNSIDDENQVIPSFLKICKRSDPDLNECILDSIESLRDRIGMGIPELYIPKVDPLEVPEVKMDQDSGAVVLRSLYKDIVVDGLSQFEITHLDLGVDTNNLDISVNFPTINLMANYEISGKIMMLPLLGDGPCQANFTEVNATAHLRGERYTKKDKEYLSIKNITVSYTIGNSKVHLGNLFNGDTTLGSTMNAFLNDNWKSVAEEIRPVMEDVMEQMLHTTTSKLFSSFSIDDLLPM